jgi:hypothetical protein
VSLPEPQAASTLATASAHAARHRFPKSFIVSPEID